MTYAGNTVSSGSTGKVFDTYGYHVPTAAAGGFLFLDRGASVAFNVESGATLTPPTTPTASPRPSRTPIPPTTAASTPLSRRKAQASSSSTAILTSTTVQFKSMAAR